MYLKLSSKDYAFTREHENFVSTEPRFTTPFHIEYEPKQVCLICMCILYAIVSTLTGGAFPVYSNKQKLRVTVKDENGKILGHCKEFLGQVSPQGRTKISSPVKKYHVCNNNNAQVVLFGRECVCSG